MLWLPYLEQCSIRILSHSTASSRNELAAERARQAVEISRLGKTLVDVGEFLAGHAYLRAPRFLARTYSKLIRAIFHEDDGVVDKSYNVFRYDKYREPNTNHYLRLILNSEYALDIKDLETALRSVREVIRCYQKASHYINYPRIHIRFTQGSEKTLIGLNSGRDTAHVGIYIVASIRHRTQIELARAVEQVFIDHHGRPHWGKYRYQLSETYKETYPLWRRFQEIRAELDPIGLFADGADMFAGLDLLEHPLVGAMWRSLIAPDTYFPVRLL